MPTLALCLPKIAMSDLAMSRLLTSEIDTDCTCHRKTTTHYRRRKNTSTRTCPIPILPAAARLCHKICLLALQRRKLGSRINILRSKAGLSRCPSKNRLRGEKAQLQETVPCQFLHPKGSHSIFTATLSPKPSQAPPSRDHPR